MVANTKGMKRKSLAPQNTSPKKTSKVTSISANNTPAKLKTPMKPLKKTSPLPIQQKTPLVLNKGAKKQQKTPSKMVANDSSDEEEEEEQSSGSEDALELEEDSDNEDVDSGDMQEDEEDSDEEENSDDDMEGNGVDDNDDSDASDVEEEPVAKPVKANNKKMKQDDAPKKIAEKTKKQNDPPKKVTAPTPDRVSRDEKFVLFVGQLNFKTTDEQVRQYFRKAGLVDGVHLSKFRNNVSRGYGFVRMKDEAGFKKALKLHNSTLDDRQINVEVANKPSEKKKSTLPKPKKSKSKKNKKAVEA
ncbi:hypothetical protein PPYR_02444 [Photinus pyralis]|uniref:RRM domain-containing protein n=1 Tax=Photinus pyralis TaxID=7054 RepID=A0A5N4B7E3_PHOPY|nr:nucleolin 1-like [Photinus pyralis]KAB0805474.1 hypothetical protein PPYR_02444 [Photinus pyralis]